ncbi:MAG: CehA/McbA family metallohydrolase [Verrucomicrobiota bacterium]
MKNIAALPTIIAGWRGMAKKQWLAIAVVLLTFHTALFGAELQTLSAARFHLGVEGFPEWAEFADSKPHGRRLDLTFSAQATTDGHTLFLRQHDVKNTWQVQVNGKRLGNLVTQETPLIAHFEVPPGLIREGTNTLSIVPPAATDDIEISDIRLAAGPSAGVLNQGSLNLSVTEAPGSQPIPCRITITDASGALAALVPLSGTNTNSLAMTTRPGVIYTRDGTARIGLVPGDYALYASRGMEYSVATQQVTIARGEARAVNLVIRREVNTKSWVAADTHIHTRTYSGHGDATLDERMLTIAGEGIELAVATDHNHHADYSDAAIRTKLQQHFTSVVGNEVTTKSGHFNAFPIASGSTVADFKSTDWNELIKGIRATPGVQVVTLNHPRDLHSGFIPLGPTNFNPMTGQHVRMTSEIFDAIEVITSGAMQSDIYLLYRDWFALLNRGHRVMAVGSSDTHDVSRFILGQGRTYLAAPDDDVARIDVNAACRSLKAGRASVSFGLFADMDVAQKFHLGDLATNLTDEFIVTVHADSPSWTWVQKVELFANGVKIRETDYLQPRVRLRRSSGFVLNRPFHDVYLVGLATGPGVTAPFAETPRPYQPTSKTFTPKVLASTNPIWIDGDGDGKYTSPRGYAEQLVKDYGTNPERLLPALAPYDEAIITQTLALCHELGVDLGKPEFLAAMRSASTKLQNAFTRYQSSVPGK